MEYLVTMTTHVPDGTSRRPSRHPHPRGGPSGQLARRAISCAMAPTAATGRMAQLGLFAADDGRLEELASMPLRVWRTDGHAPPHPKTRPETVRRSPDRGRVLPFVAPELAGRDAHQPAIADCRTAGALGRPARRRWACGRLPTRRMDDPRVAAAVTLDERADHAAHPPPE